MNVFDFSKTFKRVYVKKGETDGRIQVDDSGYIQPIEASRKKTYSLPELMEYERAKAGDIKKSKMSRKEENEEEEEEEEENEKKHELNALEESSVTMSASDANNLREEKFNEISKIYFENEPNVGLELVVNNYRKKIVSMVQANEVTILTGPTGCGKTTKVPQFILDASIEAKKYCNIIVSQPRRIAAISIAKRVSEERNWPLGSIVGYKVGLKSCTSEETLITYMTIGVLLQKLVNKANMDQYTHIILDEIHERDQSMDFVLLVIKKLLEEGSAGFKVILMSATVDHMKFAEYFSRFRAGSSDFAPIISIESSTNFPVHVHYLDELSALGELPEIRVDEPHVSELGYEICIKLLRHFEKMDDGSKEKGSVLVFLPGLYEIEHLYSKLKDPKVFASGETHCKWYPLPLHSSITTEEQIQVFRPPPTHHRKIILSTNLAESSITVPGVVFVIDFCLTKCLRTDKETNFTSLQLTWASKVNCCQRAGRVGRVKKGKVYRMVYKKFYEEMEEEALPEMLTAPLEKVVLQAKVLDMEEPRKILASALDPPDLTDIEYTILILKELGGLLRTRKGVWTPFDGDLTFLGRLMASLPVDIHITRLLVLGHLFSCLEDCIIIGACMSLKSVFSHPFKAKLKAYNSKLDWADGSCSDCIAFLNVYEVWLNNQKNGYFRRSAGDSETNWAKRHFIQLSALNEVRILAEELTMRLKESRIQVPLGRGKVQWSELHKALVLKMVIAGAFYPNYFGRGAQGARADERSIVKILGGRNPFTTVYFRNYPPEQPVQLYAEFIREELSECKEIANVSSDGSCKVFVEFRHRGVKAEDASKRGIPFDGTLPGRIPMAVYRAVKIRHIRKHININVLPLSLARKRVAEMGVKPSDPFADDDPSSPSVAAYDAEITCVPLVISYIVNPGNFWAYDSGDRGKQRFIFERLNDGCRLPTFDELPNVGDVCAAPHEEDDDVCLYRARVEEVIVEERKRKAQVFFVDYGNCAVVDVRDLRMLTPRLSHAFSRIPPLAFECVLSKIRPSLIVDSRGKWSTRSRTAFDDLVRDGKLIGSIYSVVNGVVALELFKVDDDGRQMSINERLIRDGLAEPAEENYLSKEDNEMRKRIQEGMLSGTQGRRSREAVASTGIRPPDRKECTVPLELRGPFSPLEMTLYPYARGSMGKSVTVAPESVNSVLLDSDPQDPHEWLLVAAHVSQNPSGSGVCLRNTTVMPNIRGLAALVPFIFAPEVEMRVSRDRRHYNGMLCGLGADADGRSLLPEHDFEMYFDCEISFEDFVTVNNLRFFMSMLLLTEKGESVPDISYPDVIRYQKKIEKNLLSLLSRQRKPREVEFSRRQHKWGLCESDLDVDNPIASGYNRSSIFRFHPGVSLRSDQSNG